MTTPLTDEEIEKRARRRVDQKMGFYTHALVFVLVNAGLYIINQYQGGPRWHAWPLGWWGLGLAIHGVVTFLGGRGAGLRERMLADEIAKLKNRR